MADFKNWVTVCELPSKRFTCGHCGCDVSADRGYTAGNALFRIYICHACGKPTFFDQNTRPVQVPGSPYGGPVHDIPDPMITEMYEEAKRCVSANCPTAAVLCCRKLLMHISTSKGAPPNQTFQSYVQFLADQHYIPPDAKDWVDIIRQVGNEANHEIKLMGQIEARELIDFSEMLLRVIYEFPAGVQRRKAQQQAPAAARPPPSSPKATGAPRP